MKVIRAFCLCWLLMLAGGVSAQLVDKVLSVLDEDSVNTVTVVKADSDSIQLSLIRQELEAARLNEADLRMEMEQMKLAGYAADSVKLALQKQRIDSLRTVTPGIPVVEKDTLFYLYAKRGGHTPQQRAKDVSNVIEALGTRFNLRPDSVYLESTDIVTDLMYGEKVIISFQKTQTTHSEAEGYQAETDLYSGLWIAGYAEAGQPAGVCCQPGALCSHAVAAAADGSVIILHFPSDQEPGLYIILLHLESYKGHLEWNSRLYTQSVHYLCDMLCGEVPGQTGALSCQ